MAKLGLADRKQLFYIHPTLDAVWWRCKAKIDPMSKWLALLFSLIRAVGCITVAGFELTATPSVILCLLRGCPEVRSDEQTIRGAVCVVSRFRFVVLAAATMRDGLPRTQALIVYGPLRADTVRCIDRAPCWCGL